MTVKTRQVSSSGQHAMAWRHILGKGFCLGPIVLAFRGASAAAGYLLQPGDTVEVTVQGVPDLKRRAMIREDGYIPFPLIGNIEFANHTLVQVRDNIVTSWSAATSLQLLMLRLT